MNRVIKFIVVSLIIFNVTFLISGCWDNRNIDDLALIKGIALDTAEEDDRFKLTAHIVRPTPGEGGAEEQMEIDEPETISSTGYTLFEANRNLIKQIGRTPFYNHSDVIIISEEIARKGIKPYLDHLARNKEIRGRAKLIISKGEAAKILDTPHYLEDVIAVGLEKIVNGVALSGTIIGTNLREFNIDLFDEKIDPVATAVELREGGPEDENNNNNQDDEQNLVFSDGGAFFKGETFQDWFTRKEARGYNWVRNPGEVRGPVVCEVPVELEGNEVEKRISIEIVKSHSKIQAELIENENNQFKIVINVDARGVIIEDIARNYEVLDTENIQKLDKRFAQVINNEIINTLKKSRKYQADVFGFARAVNNSYPQEYQEIKNDWDNIYQNIPVEINIVARIRRTGMLN